MKRLLMASSKVCTNTFSTPRPRPRPAPLSQTSTRVQKRFESSAEISKYRNGSNFVLATSETKSAEGIQTARATRLTTPSTTHGFLVEQDLGLWKHLKPAEQSLAVERRTGKRPPSLEHCYSDLLLYPPPQIVRADNSLALTDEALQLPKRVLFAQLTVLADNFDVASVCAMLDELKREIM